MENAVDVAGAKLYSWNSIPPEYLNPMFTRQYVHGEEAMLAKISLKKGCFVPTHQHPNEQISLVIAGSMEFQIGDQKQTVHAGDLLIIPANLPHAAVALEDFEGLDVFAPPRQDWIQKTDSYLR